MMAQAQYTPGPWFPLESPTPGFWYVMDSSNNDVCDISLMGKHANRQANARLIAAAPDMLAALEGMDEELSLWGADTIETMNLKARLDAIRTAIAKALGQPD